MARMTGMYSSPSDALLSEKFAEISYGITPCGHILSFLAVAARVFRLGYIATELKDARVIDGRDQYACVSTSRTARECSALHGPR